MTTQLFDTFALKALFRQASPALTARYVTKAGDGAPKQYIIIQGQLAVAVTRYTEFDNYVEVLPQDLVKVLSAPRGVYLKPRRLKFVGHYTIIEQRARTTRQS